MVAKTELEEGKQPLPPTSSASSLENDVCRQTDADLFIL